jgi:hypothetical protein
MGAAVLIGRDPATHPLPQPWGSHTRALLVSHDKRHLFVTPSTRQVEALHGMDGSPLFCVCFCFLSTVLLILHLRESCSVSDPDPGVQVVPDPDLYIFTHCIFIIFLAVGRKEYRFITFVKLFLFWMDLNIFMAAMFQGQLLFDF